VKRNHLRREATSGLHRRWRKRDDTCDRELRSRADGDGAAEGVPGEDGAFGDDGFARGEIADERECARAITVCGIRAGGAAVTGEVGHEDTEILVSEFLSVKSHDLFVGGETVKKDYRTDGSAGARLINVGGHAAAARGRKHGVNIVGIAMSQEKAQSAEEQASAGLQECTLIHRGLGGCGAIEKDTCTCA